MAYSDELEQTTQLLLTEGKGILAADESTPTIARRFASVEIPSDEETRRSYRELLFTTPDIEQFISGVILFDETIRQRASDGSLFPVLLEQRGIVPGIKVDRGATQLPGSPDEKVTEGLDGLRERLVEYRALGARFAKWRAVITIGSRLPTRYCLRVNAQALARYAKLCQESGLVPIVEPEVVMDGDHTLQRCGEVTLETLHTVFAELFEQGVNLEQMLLKPNMVLPGAACLDQASPAEVAQMTLRCLRQIVPAAVPGIVFLSGGQSPDLATAHLNAMAVSGPQPWELSFSFARALQAAALAAWRGRLENVAAGQAAFYQRAECAGAARRGVYSPQMEVVRETHAAWRAPEVKV
jgi:fructose-bisphosphate aldolase, class I